MKRLLLVTALLGAMLAPSFTSLAGGLIVCHGVIIIPPPFPRPPIIIPPRPWPRPIRHVFAPMELQEQKVTVKIDNRVARTTVEQVFYNPNPRRQEGTFLFPVPKGAAIENFQMEINGKLVKAELLDAKKARKIYTDIVRSMKDPALLEYSNQRLFKVSIFPFEPHGKKRIKLTYNQVLRNDAGLVEYTYPLGTGKYSSKAIGSLSVKIELAANAPIKSIYSPTHEVEIKRNGNKQATIGFEAKGVTPGSDFKLYYQPKTKGIAVNLITHRQGDGDGYFLLLASPGIDVDASKIVEKDVAFVLDTSGSMAGNKLEQAKKAFQFCVANLNDGDRFEVIRFSTETEALFDGMKKAQAEKERKDKADQKAQAEKERKDKADQRDKRILWIFETGGHVRSSPAIGSDGTVYVGSEDKKVYALDGQSGAKKWEFETGDEASSSPAIGADGTVYVGSHDNKVYALNGKNGAKKWEFVTGGVVYSSPAVGSDGTVYVGSSDNKLYALDGQNGAKKWEFVTGGGVYSSPAIGSDGTVYVGSYDNKVYALHPNGPKKLETKQALQVTPSPATGAAGPVLWEFITGGNVRSSPAIGSDGTIYVGTHDNKLYALDGKNGAKKWELESGDRVNSSPAIGSDGTVYVGSIDKKFYALDGKTGVKKWEFVTGEWAPEWRGVYSSPAIGSDGIVYVGSHDSKVYALDAKTGAKQWEFTTGGPIRSSPVIGADGTVYVGGLTRVYAFKTDSKGPAKSPWSMRGQNARHTGRAPKQLK